MSDPVAFLGVAGTGSPILVSSANPLPVAATVTATATTVAKATAAAPSYTEGTEDDLSMTLAGSLRVTNTTALAAGSNVIGHVIVDTTSTTAVTQATAANLNAAVVGTGTAGTAAGGVLTIQGVASMTKLLVTPDSVALPANQSVNNAQINGITPLMGNGATGTGSQRVTIASDNTAFTVNPAGATASGSSLTVNPVTTGGRGATANPTAVADGQVVNAMFDKLGKQVVVGAIRTLKGTQNTIITASTAETTIVTAVASTFLDLYGLILANTGATTTKVNIRDTTGGSIIATLEVPTLETRGFMLSVDSAIAQTTVNTNWTAQCASSTSSLEVTALYVKNT